MDNRPPARRVSEMLAAQINSLGLHFTEVLNDHTRTLGVGAGIDPHPPVDRQLPVGLALATPGTFEHCPPPEPLLVATASTSPVGRRWNPLRLVQSS